MAKQYEKHPAAGNFRQLTGDDWESFKADILHNGQRHPIMIFEGKILDGWNRYLGCLEVGVKPIFETLPKDTKPEIYVRSVNVYRRHLDKSERNGTILEMRAAGASLAVIAEATATPRPTVQKVVERAKKDKSSGVSFDTPQHNGAQGKVTGKDGKQYAAQVEDMEIPEEEPEPKSPLQAAVDLHKPTRDFALKCHALAREFEALTEPHPHISTQSVTNHLKAVAAEIRLGQPHAICPYCVGKRCITCYQSGYVNRVIYDQSPKEKQAAVETV